MKVILLKDHKPLGKEGNVINVADGHALNFLFPQHIAVEASPEAIRNIQIANETEKRQTSKVTKRNEEAAAKLDGFEVVIKEKTTEEGKLYAAVNAKVIKKALRLHGFQVNDKQIQMTPTKDLGPVSATVQFPGGLEAEVRIIVEAS